MPERKILFQTTAYGARIFAGTSDPVINGTTVSPSTGGGNTAEMAVPFGTALLKEIAFHYFAFGGAGQTNEVDQVRLYAGGVLVFDSGPGLALGVGFQVYRASPGIVVTATKVEIEVVVIGIGAGVFLNGGIVIERI